MDDWRDLLSLTANSFAVAAVTSLLGAGIIGSLAQLVPSFRRTRTQASDRRFIRIFMPALFLVVFVPSMLIGYSISGACGTGDLTEVPAPDRKHKVVVYNFDCGATTDFSLNVSLLNVNQSLPKHKAAPLLYSHYHQRPTSLGDRKNFEVVWQDPAHVTIRLQDYDRRFSSKCQDGIQVAFEPLP